MKLGLRAPPGMMNQPTPIAVPSGKIVASHDRGRMVLKDKVIKEEPNDDEVNEQEYYEKKRYRKPKGPNRPLRNIEEESKVQYDSHFLDDDERENDHSSNRNGGGSSGNENIEVESHPN